MSKLAIIALYGLTAGESVNWCGAFIEINKGPGTEIQCRIKIFNKKTSDKNIYPQDQRRSEVLVEEGQILSKNRVLVVPFVPFFNKITFIVFCVGCAGALAHGPPPIKKVINFFSNTIIGPASADVPSPRDAPRQCIV